MEMITGYWLTLNFQVSHVSPSAEVLSNFPIPSKADKSSMDNTGKKFKDEWALTQLKTTVDYAHGDKIYTLLSGALNYQTTHHLFPGVSQYHYPAIALIVRKTAKEFGYPYFVLPSFWAALSCHFKQLETMGFDKHHHH